MLPISLNAQSAAPFYQQIIDQIRNLALTGRLPPGFQLPSVRGLAKELAVSVITVRRAYDELERAGIIYTRSGLGSFITEHNQTQRDAARLEQVRVRLAEVLAEANLLGITQEQLQRMFIELLNQTRRGE